jgi:hypothetical protein
MILMSMEQERSLPPTGGVDPSLTHQMMFSELWIGSAYEMIRLLRERRLVEGEEFIKLYDDLTLLRILLEKYEISGDRKLKNPLSMQRGDGQGPRGHFSYEKNNPLRAHIMPTGLSPRGSIIWHTVDLKSNSSRWLKARDLSERFLNLWKT